MAKDYTLLTDALVEVGRPLGLDRHGSDVSDPGHVGKLAAAAPARDGG